ADRTSEPGRPAVCAMGGGVGNRRAVGWLVDGSVRSPTWLGHSSDPAGPGQHHGQRLGAPRIDGRVVRVGHFRRTGSGAALLARAAVADMYPIERRGVAVGFLLAAGTVGAIVGPQV